MITLALVAIAGVLIGAYGHKYLASEFTKITGVVAPTKVTAASATAAVENLTVHGVDAAHTAIDAAASAAKSAVSK